MKRKVDICVLSDVHLGHPTCQAGKLIQYLEGIAPDVLILNGDFIDRSRSKDPVTNQEAYAVFEQIMHLAGRRTKIYYISGQQDQFFRKLTNRPFLNIHLRNKLILQLQGKKHLFFHGDILSLPGWIHRLLKQRGSKGFDERIRLQLWREWLQKYRPQHLTRQLAPQSLETFKKHAIQIAEEMDCDMVICGHCHFPEMQRGQKITYLNAGDWLQHCSALEYQSGQWSLYLHDAAAEVAPHAAKPEAAKVPDSKGETASD